MQPLMGIKVAVGVSGGVDSLYSAISLKEAGADVLPVHALFLPEQLRSPELPGMLGRLDAALDAFGMRLKVMDLSADFERNVIRPFMRAYAEGRTPNPCANCNRTMKFGQLWEAASRLGAERIATGHYARMLELQDGPALYAGKDPAKDQSYFLSLTPLEALRRAFFPLGNKRKTDIVALIAERGIEVPQKQESQEICFIPNDDYRGFLQMHAMRWLDDAALPGEGEVTLPDGKVIARHKGLWNYTEGQRRGLGIAWSEPLFVLRKDVEHNRLVVGGADHFAERRCVVGDVNYLVPFERWPQSLLAKTRYRQALAPVKAEQSVDAEGASVLRLEFLQDTPGAPAAPGQIAVVYEDAGNGLRVLAGGTLKAQ